MSHVMDQVGAGTAGNARARALTLERVRSMQPSATSAVGYRSAGRLLIIGDAAKAIPLAKRLRGQLRCTVLPLQTPARAEISIRGRDDGIRVIIAKPAGIDGYLGDFTVTVHDQDAVIDLAQRLGPRDGSFDLVLDLTTPPHIDREMNPPGYFAPRDDAAALDRALDELPGLVGEFEKPKFFHYNPDICAHGARGVHACHLCIDACPTEAIVSLGEKVEVSPYLCQGGGSCATVCPSGAMTYSYPPADDLLNRIRALARHYREAGGQTPVLLFHDAASGNAMVTRSMDRLPGNVIPLQIEEVGVAGMDAWFAALAYGMDRTVLLLTPDTAPRVRSALQQQFVYAGAVLEGMGYAARRIWIVDVADDSGLLRVLRELEPFAEIHPASFTPMDDKRTNLRLAIDHLYRHAPTQVSEAPLPAGSPFGEIEVDREACTLCMACVSVCPTLALADGYDMPQLRFDEWNCVQCGLCETACPEGAITRHPRFVYDPELRRRTRVLNEDEPFCCIVCGKPFATRGIMQAMNERLKDHYMFQSAEAKRRMQMCEDCRVRDLFRREAGPSRG